MAMGPGKPSGNGMIKGPGRRSPLLLSPTIDNLGGWMWCCPWKDLLSLWSQVILGSDASSDG